EVWGAGKGGGGGRAGGEGGGKEKDEGGARARGFEACERSTAERAAEPRPSEPRRNKMMTSTLFLLALRGLTLGDQFQVTRIGALAVSPDGKTLVYEASTLDREANSRHVDLWALATAGGTPRRLTSAGKLNEHPSFAPDSQRIAYASDRDGTPQIWIHDLARATDTRLTQLALGASGPVVSADGKWIAFTSEMFIGCKDEACNHARVEA